MSEETIPQMREAIDRLTEKVSGLEKDNSDLRGELRVRDAQDAFRAEGYNPAHGKLFAAVNPEGEITAEAVTAFADEQGLPLLDTSGDGEAQEGGDSTPDGGDGSTALSGMAGAGSRAGDGGAGGADQKQLTRQQYLALAKEDPAAARAAVASGNVEISADNPHLAGGGVSGTGNPYARANAPSE